jgi:UDP-N-acetylglucosamine 2-epimerase (non-hydrolysing)
MNIQVLDVVAGARPNFMKVAPILRAVGATESLRARLVHTGQHYDPSMSDIFFKQLGIAAPDVHLGVGSGSHGAQTARVLAAYEERLLADPPRGVIVVGDVNSTLACTLAAVKLGIPVAHVEAGLRSFDRSMPEEINRVMTDAVADVLFVSEPSGMENLRGEGVAADRVVLVGNVMIDTLVAELPAARATSRLVELGLVARGYAYVTLHRPSNVDDPARLAELVGVLSRLARTLPVVFAVHPRTLQRLATLGQLHVLEEAPGIVLLAPQGYRESLALMADAAVAVTDSGGIQEETTFLGVPCLTVRPNTERPVTVELGTNTIVGNDLSLIEPLVGDVLGRRYKTGGPVPLWDGQAAERIVAELARRWAAAR